MRLFVAIRLPEECRPAVAKAAAPLEGALGARLLEAENWHLTLKFIGDAGEADATRISGALAEISFAPFAVSLFGAGAYPSNNVPRAIYVGGESEGAKELAKKVDGALSFLGGKPEKFSVHLTVARSTRSFGTPNDLLTSRTTHRSTVSKGVADIEEFVQKTGAVCEFEAKSFCLMRSTLGAQGAIYEVLREYPANG
ncbi:MAG: RNA 2',3'-cyclic phosphodiesterase [Candidatus Micrarchaeia archaeon]|jgi:2'-5' RNA ligase